MKTKIIILLLITFQIIYIQAQNSEKNYTDSIVSLALSLSEKAIYDVRFEEAKGILDTSYFKNLKYFDDKHEILLTIQYIRIDWFMNRIYLTKSKSIESFKRLKVLFPLTEKTKDKEVLAKYFLALSNSYRSVGKKDSAKTYQAKALSLFQQNKNYKKISEIRASIISREHMVLLKQKKKEEILELIPQYKEEIEFSRMHSKYVLSYNTRHLAQIHRRQTLNYKEALKLFKESLNLREEIGFKPFLPASYSSLGEVYHKMNKHTKAIEMFHKSSKLAEEIGFVRYQSYPNLQIGDIYLTLGETKKASEYYTKALKLASENNYSIGIDEAIERLKKMNNRD